MLERLNIGVPSYYQLYQQPNMRTSSFYQQQQYVPGSSGWNSVQLYNTLGDDEEEEEDDD